MPKLHDAIERFGRLNLEENETPRDDQTGPSKKIPKWARKTLKGVYLDDVTKTSTTNSTKHDDGGEANYSGDYMDVSFDCELNLSVNSEPNPLIKFDECDEWKEAMQN